LKTDNPTGASQVLHELPFPVVSGHHFFNLQLAEGLYEAADGLSTHSA
jgi:hypothetical protein